MKIYKTSKFVESKLKISQNFLIKEVDSDLFQGSGCNDSTDQSKIDEFANIMRYNGWGNFPPIKGKISSVSEGEFEDYKDAVEGGYEHELDYSRELFHSDIGKPIARISDGHNRAYAAKACGIPIKIDIVQ